MMVIDQREPDKFKYKDWGFETELENKALGDYHIEGIVIERKEINDYVKSLDQRLWEQAYGLEEAISNDDVISATIIIHGTVSKLNSRNMEPRKIEGIYGSIARLNISYDVNIIWVREESQFVKIVKKIHEKAGTETSKKKPHLTKRKFRDDRINVLFGIHGIGTDTAKNLLDEFGSISSICQQDRQSLQKADGVGGKTAKKVHDILHDGEENNLLS